MEKSFLVSANEEGREKMDSALSSFGDMYTKTTVGKSILSKNIDAYIIGKGRSRVALFGAHHASESITCNLLFTFIYKFLSRISEGCRRECEMIDRFSYIIVPAVNPDGMEIALGGEWDSPISARTERMLGESRIPWQANLRGVDLNHNYDFGFYEYKRIEMDRGISAGASLYSGEYPESEPETRAVARLVRATSPIGILSFHSQGEEIIHRDDEKLSRIAKRLSRYSGYEGKIPDGSAAYGGLSDYTSSIGIPSFTIEVGRGVNPLPLSLLPSIVSRLYTMILLFPTFL